MSEIWSLSDYLIRLSDPFKQIEWGSENKDPMSSFYVMSDSEEENKYYSWSWFCKMQDVYLLFSQSLLIYAGLQYTLLAEGSYPQHIFNNGFIFDRGANIIFKRNNLNYPWRFHLQVLKLFQNNDLGSASFISELH